MGMILIGLITNKILLIIVKVIPDRQIEVIHITMNGLSAFEITSFKTIFNPRATIAINIHTVVITFIIFISNEGIGTNVLIQAIMINPMRK